MKRLLPVIFSLALATSMAPMAGIAEGADDPVAQQAVEADVTGQLLAADGVGAPEDGAAESAIAGDVAGESDDATVPAAATDEPSGESAAEEGGEVPDATAADLGARMMSSEEISIRASASIEGPGEASCMIKGDSDGDGIVTADDSVVLRETYVDLQEAPAEGSDAFWRCDVDEDNKLTLKDDTRLKQALLGNTQVLTWKATGSYSPICRLAAIRVNGKEIPVPAEGTEADAEVDGITYHVAMINNSGSNRNFSAIVTGPALESNDVVFVVEAPDPIQASASAEGPGKASCMLKGDADNDGDADVDDLEQVAQMAARLMECPDEGTDDFWRCDVNDDGKISTRDAAWFSQAFASNTQMLAWKAVCTPDAEQGARVVAIRVNGSELPVPADGAEADAEADGVSCHIAAAEDGVVTVTGQALNSNDIVFVLEGTCLITYDLNGGTIDGESGSVSYTCTLGEVISILEAPVREGWTFLYWKGSEYSPGDAYTVEGDHTFTAQWAKADPAPADNADSSSGAAQTRTAGTGKAAASGSSLPKTGDAAAPLALALVLAALAALGSRQARRRSIDRE